MLFIDSSSFNKTKKVLLPGIKVGDLKPIAGLLSPQFLLIPLVFISLISQVVENLKNILSPREVQQLFSVRFYTKVLSCGFSSLNLSIIYAISKTLGPELEILSVLNVSERLQFLKDLKKKIIFDNGPSKIISRPQLLYNPVELMKHRRGLSLQTRSVMIANSIFSPSSIVMGLSINSINLTDILNSAKIFWSLLNLEEEEFDFLLRKEASFCLKKLSSDSKLLQLFPEPCNNLESLKILVFAECKSILNFQSQLSFLEDQVVIQGESNLTLLEKELNFISRSILSLPNDVFVSDFQLGDVILRASLDQRRRHKLEVENIFKKSGFFADKHLNKLSSDVLNKLKTKKNLG